MTSSLPRRARLCVHGRDYSVRPEKVGILSPGASDASLSNKRGPASILEGELQHAREIVNQAVCVQDAVVPLELDMCPGRM